MCSEFEICCQDDGFGEMKVINFCSGEVCTQPVRKFHERKSFVIFINELSFTVPFCPSPKYRKINYLLVAFTLKSN